MPFVHGLNLVLQNCFGIVPLSGDEMFKFSDVGTRGHGYKLSKTYCASTTRHWFFTQRIIN